MGVNERFIFWMSNAGQTISQHGLQVCFNHIVLFCFMPVVCIYLLSYRGRKEGYVYMSMSKVTLRVVFGEQVARVIPTASFSSTSCETRDNKTHWKVQEAMLKTKSFTNFHFRCGFLFAPFHFIFTGNFNGGFFVCIVSWIWSDGGSWPPYEPIHSFNNTQEKMVEKSLAPQSMVKHIQ